jgi:flagellar basal body-associated protein FliL
MIVSIIIMLIVALIVIALWVSAVQQHKEKQETERRKDLTKQKKIIEESEDVLLNSANIPMSENILRILQRRIHDALVTMVQLSPNSKELKNRLKEVKERLGNPLDATNSENLVLPDNDKQLISLIQGIKKLRAVLRSEHGKGKVDSQVFVAEDKRLEKLQLRINIESQIKRGISARSANMVGSARQYFEKAYATVSAVAYSDDYITGKRQELEGYLEAISTELKASNATALKKKAEQEQDDLDVLFAPKKKW